MILTSMLIPLQTNNYAYTITRGTLWYIYVVSALFLCIIKLKYTIFVG